MSSGRSSDPREDPRERGYEPSLSIDRAMFRHVLGHYPTGVTVVTASRGGNEPIGVTVGSFTSVSLDPPLVGFFPMADSKRWSSIADVGSFCVNVLAHDQGQLCWRFSKRSIERPFEGAAWYPSPITGSPVLDGAIAWIDCRIEQVVSAGDHYFVMGRVLALEHLRPELDPVPLLFYRGEMGRFQPTPT